MPNDEFNKKFKETLLQSPLYKGLSGSLSEDTLERILKNSDSSRDRIKGLLEEAEKGKSNFFTPAFSEYDFLIRNTLLETITNNGWRLTHWSVVPSGKSFMAFPVFERTDVI
jgi:hypothetical protein